MLPVVEAPAVVLPVAPAIPAVVPPPSVVQQAVQNAVQQPVVSNNNPVINNPANTMPDVSNAGKPPVNVVLPQEGTLPVVDLSSGLAFVELSAPNGQSGSESGNGSSGGGDLAPPAGVTGMDPLGFMRVFVTRGGINMPEQASNDVGAENTRRKEELAN